MSEPRHLHDFPASSSTPLGMDKHYRVYDMSPAGHARSIGTFDTAEHARRFAEKITALHSQMWRFASERNWHFELLHCCRERWERAPRLMSVRQTRR